ncbi:MAG: aromatic amino acid aminotransferase [Rhodospirillales bacterium 69-11]|jgi:aromatic-amino-acid transaminase|nr:MAG: aromatic amino acid aminotransferase [Rhodospirillales bacterium 69-11]
MYHIEPTPSVFAGLQRQAPDPLLSLIALYRDDPRPDKIDLGVGVYRDAEGATPVFAAVKAAELALLHNQKTKAYLGPEGDIGFLEGLTPVVFGDTARPDDLVSVQTPGGTGALRLAAELVATGRPRSRVWMGTPSWPIHPGIFEKARLEVRAIPYFDQVSQVLDYDRYLNELGAAQPGDVALLHGACHNPTGADPSFSQWSEIADLLQRRGVVPLVDLAYQGLGAGLDEDAAGLRLLMERCETVIVAQSCDKNFGLYRERTGALFVRTRPSQQTVVRSNILQLARCAWSMPPDHGAAVVRIILETESLDLGWRAELAGVRGRLNALRSDLSASAPQLQSLGDRRGLFALLPLTSGAVEALRANHGVYMAGSGRINLAGLNEATLPVFANALAAVL